MRTTDNRQGVQVNTTEIRKPIRGLTAGKWMSKTYVHVIHSAFYCGAMADPYINGETRTMVGYQWLNSVQPIVCYETLSTCSAR